MLLALESRTVKNPYRRVLLKLSGESLQGEAGHGIDGPACQSIASQIAEVHKMGVQLGLVLGGGNIFRGAKAAGLSLGRTQADQIGMLATLMNGIALQQALQALSVPTRLFSSIPCGFIEAYSWSAAISSLEQGHIVL